MTEETKVPSLPAVTKDNVGEFAQAVKQILDVREGKLGDPLDANVTYRDLIKVGALTLRPGWSGRTGNPVMPPWVSPDGYDPTTDLTPPPRPENFTATGLFALVQLQWDAPKNRNHAYAEIWRSNTNVLGNAVMIGTSTSRFFVDSLGANASRYYWVRFVSQANVSGPYNDDDGTLGQTAQDPALLIASLQGQIRASELHNSLSTRIDLIDAPANITDSVAWRVAQEASARATSIQQEASTRAQAILDEASARATSDQALQTQINTLSAASSGDFSELLAAVQEEQTARISGDNAQALARETLATQLRGNYTGTDPTALTTGIVFNERQARITAESVISSSVTALSATVTNNYNTLNAAITSEATTRANSDTAISNNLTSLTATVGTKNRTYRQTTAPATGLISGDIWFDTANGNLAKRWNGSAWETTDDTRIAGNAAAITSEQTARVNADNALTSSITALTATVTSNKSAADAAILAEQTARAAADTAEAAERSTLSTQLRGTYTGTDVTQLTTGLIFSERQARVTADSALSTSISQVSARLNSGGDIYSSLVTVQNTASAKSANFVQATAPTATKVDDLWIDTANGNLLKRWTGSAWAAADDTRIGSQATSITQLSARLNDAGGGVSMEQKFSANASQITGLQGQYTVKIDNSGYVTGFGLASTANGATPQSAFSVRADSFYVANPSGPGVAPAIPFIVRTTETTIGGVSVPVGVYLADAFIQNGTISNAKIANAAIDNAKIANLDAAKITSGLISADRLDADTITSKVLTVDWAKITNVSIGAAQIQDGVIGTAEIVDTLSSLNYSSTAGWQINKAGSAVFNEVSLRGAINGGAYTGWAWPAAGAGTGFHLGPNGLLLGNYNAVLGNGSRSYFQVEANGNLYSPGLNIISGVATFTGSLNVRSAASGARMEIYNNVIKVFDSNGVLRVQIGDLAA